MSDDTVEIDVKELCVFCMRKALAKYMDTERMSRSEMLIRNAKNINFDKKPCPGCAEKDKEIQSYKECWEREQEMRIQAEDRCAERDKYIKKLEKDRCSCGGDGDCETCCMPKDGPLGCGYWRKYYASDDCHDEKGGGDE